LEPILKLFQLNVATKEKSVCGDELLAVKGGLYSVFGMQVGQIVSEQITEVIIIIKIVKRV